MELQVIIGHFCVNYNLNDRFITTQNYVSQSVTALLQLSIKFNTVAVSVRWLGSTSAHYYVLRLTVYVNGTLQ